MRTKGCLLRLALFVIVLSACAFGVLADVENVVSFNGYPVIRHDPAFVVDFFDIHACINAYDTLTYFSVEGVPVPHLATSWTATPDAKTWDFSLQRGVKFHDGSELTSEDVVFSWERMMAIGRGFSFYYTAIDSVTALDDYTVRMQLSSPHSELPIILLRLPIASKSIVLAHLEDGDYGDLGDYGEAWLRTHDAGSGPYMVVEHKINNYVIMERFEDYFLGWKNWGPESQPIDKVIFRMVYEPATVKTLMRTCQHEVTNQWQSMETYRALDDIEGIDLFFVPSGTLLTMWLNTRRPPTDDINFRKAMAYAMNYDAIIPLIPESKQAGVVSSGLAGFKEDLTLPSHDLNKAKEYLALSKYDPADVTLELFWSAGIPYEEKIVLQLQSDLTKLGIPLENISIAAVPWAKLQDVATKPETTPNGGLYWYAPYYPSADFFLFTHYHPDNVIGIEYTSHWMANEELGTLIDTTRATLDQEERYEIYRDLQEKILDLQLGLYFTEIPEVHAIRDYIVGPREMFTVLGPTFNFRNFQINLERKRELVGG